METQSTDITLKNSKAQTHHQILTLHWFLVDMKLTMEYSNGCFCLGRLSLCHRRTKRYDISYLHYETYQDRTTKTDGAYCVHLFVIKAGFF